MYIFLWVSDKGCEACIQSNPGHAGMSEHWDDVRGHTAEQHTYWYVVINEKQAEEMILVQLQLGQQVHAYRYSKQAEYVVLT